jgi:hypothetical protein
MESRPRGQSRDESGRWEYLTQFVYADLTKPGAEEFMRAQWPELSPAMYAPQTMIPELNQLGALGWEMVHMQPVAKVGANEDIAYEAGYGWSHTYFCVFKRRIAGG